jgi:integrase
MAKKASGKRRTKGSGYLFKRDEKLWHCRYRDETGKLVERSLGTSDHKTATGILDKWIKEVQEVKAGLVDPVQHKIRKQRKRSVIELRDEYITSCSKRAQAKRNISQKKKQLGDWIQDASANTLADLTADSLLNHLEGRAAKGLSHRCWNHTLQITNAFMNWCKKMGYIGANPLTEIPKKDEQLDQRRLRRALTDQEVDRLMTVARQRRREAWYATPLYSGLRKAELERLEWSDVNMARDQITIRKTKSKEVQHVALCPELKEILQRHQAQTGRSSGLVWTTTVIQVRQRKCFSARRFWSLLREIGNQQRTHQSRRESYSPVNT